MSCLRQPEQFGSGPFDCVRRADLPILGAPISPALAYIRAGLLVIAAAAPIRIADYACYFLRDGHIAGVEMMSFGLSDEGAIARAHVLLSKRRGPLDGFEVWDRARFVTHGLASASRRMTSE